MIKRWLRTFLEWLLHSLAKVSERLYAPEQVTLRPVDPPQGLPLEHVADADIPEPQTVEVEIPDEIILSADNLQGMLVRFSSESVLDKPVAIPPGARALAAAGPLVQNALRSSDIIERAIKAKRWVEIVGPPTALAKLDAGALKFMRAKSDGNLLGSLVDGSNTIKVQAHFKPVAAVHMAKVAGLAVFQIASVVTAQIHLADISRKLASIKASVDEVLSRQQAAVYGRVRGAIRRLEQLESAHHAGVLTMSSMQGDLATVNQDITNSFYECVRNLHDYHSRFLGPRFHRTDKTARINQLEELSGRPMVDFVTLLGLVHAQTRYYNVLMAVQATESPAALTHTQREADRALGEMLKEARWFADYVAWLQKGSCARYEMIKNEWFNQHEKDLTLRVGTMTFPALTVLRQLPAPRPEDATTRILLKPKEDGTVEAYLLPVA